MVSRMLVESHAYIHEHHELVDRFVSKVFPGYPVTFDGKIIHYNATLCPEYPFHVKYDDGDEEDISESEARRILVQGYCKPSRHNHYSQDPNSHTSRPTADGCHSPNEVYPVSDLHHACPHNGRATKLTAPNGVPGQITLVRSPSGSKAAAAQLTELQQQHFQQQQQQQLPTDQQQHEQLPTEQQQQSKKGQRSHRVRKAKVPAVAKVIAESDVARVVQNAVDVSHDKDSDVPSRAQEVAGQAGNANLEECAASDSVQYKGPPELSKAKGLNAFMAAKLATAIGKGSAGAGQGNHEVQGKKRQRQDSNDDDSVCTLSDTERDAGGDETSNAPSRGSDRAERGRGRGSRGGRASKGGRGKGGRGAFAESKALPYGPGVKKKRGRPSKAEIAARQASKASHGAANAPAAAGKAAHEHGAVPVPTADLDPPTHRSAKAAPAAAAVLSQKAAAVKAAAKKPTVATAAAEVTGDASKHKPPGAKGRPAVGNVQKPSPAVAASVAADKQDLQQLGKHASQLTEDDDDEDNENGYMLADASVPVATSKPGASKRLKRLRKQVPGAQTEKEQDTQQGLEDDDAAPAPADVVHSQGSGLSREQPVSAGEAKHVEVFVDAVGLLLDPVDAGCARARPWLKHTQKAAEEAQAAAEAAAKQSEVNDTSMAKSRSVASAKAAARAAATKEPTAVAANQDSVDQMGSGGSGPTGVAEQSGQKEFHSKARSKEGRTSATEAQQPQQQDQHSQVHRQHAPRGSRTSPRSPPPMPTVQPKHADSRTGTSHPRGGTSHPAGAAVARNADASRNRRTQHRQADDTFEEAHASPSDGARSGDSSDNATVQHGVGHTGESSEALPASMKSSKPAMRLLQPQQQQLHQPPTSSISEQVIHSAAAHTKPGRVSGNMMAIVAAEAPESSSHTGKGALVAQNADAAAPGWFSQYMNLDQMHKQTQMEKLHNMEQNSQLVLNKMEDMQKQQGVVTRVGNTHSAMGGYTRGRKWRVEERHRFITAQLYPTSDDGGNYRDQFQQVLRQLDGCLAEAGIDRRHVTEVRAHLQNLEKGQKQVCHVFEEWTSGLNPGPMLKFSSGKTGHEDVKLLMEASALVPASQQWRHPTQPMEIDNK